MARVLAVVVCALLAHASVSANQLRAAGRRTQLVSQLLAAVGSSSHFIVAGAENEMDDNVRLVIPGAMVAHAIIGPTTTKTGQVVVGHRLNNGPAARPVPVVHLDVETFADNPTVGFIINTNGKTVATDNSWAKFASTSQTACDKGDTDLFLVFHRRTSDPQLPFLIASLGSHSPKLAQEYFWPKVVQHIDKRTRRIVVVACYGWFSKSGFQRAVDKYNAAHSSAKWKPILIGNEQPMSLDADGGWKTLSTESVQTLLKNPHANVFQLYQNVSIKDARVFQIGDSPESGVEISPFPNVKLASVVSFRDCVRSKIKTFPSVQAADRAFARAMLIDPASVTETDMNDATKLCIQNEH